MKRRARIDWEHLNFLRTIGTPRRYSIKSRIFHIHQALGVNLNLTFYLWFFACVIILKTASQQVQLLFATAFKPVMNKKESCFYCVRKPVRSFLFVRD